MINIIGLCLLCHFLGGIHLAPPCRKATYSTHYSECGHMKGSGDLGLYRCLGAEEFCNCESVGSLTKGLLLTYGRLNMALVHNSLLGRYLAASFMALS